VYDLVDDVSIWLLPSNFRRHHVYWEKSKDGNWAKIWKLGHRMTLAWW